MNNVQRTALILSMTAGAIVGARSSQAQYNADFQVNVISAVSSNWVDYPSNPNAGYVVGSNWVHDALIIKDGGVLSNGYGYVGYAIGADDNFVLVSGSGSTWSASSPDSPTFIGYSGSENQLIITDGGKVYDSFGLVGWNASSSNNTAVVTGPGSIWRNSRAFAVGYLGSDNRVFVSDGGAIVSGPGGETASLLGSGGNGNVVVVNGRGSVWSNLNTTIMISSADNQLIISNGGFVYGANAGVEVDGSNNTVEVTGRGSVLSGRLLGAMIAGRSNELLITDGGMVSGGYLAGTGRSGNMALVGGSGSIWSNGTGPFFVGDGSVGDRLVITNGGQVSDRNAFISSSGASNVVLVSGNGALWQNQGTLSVGDDGFDSYLEIDAGGSVIASAASIGGPTVGARDQIIVSGGALYVTNSLATGALSVLAGTLTINCGTVEADRIVATVSPTNSVIAFTGGILSVKGTTINNGSVFTVGNSTNAATLNLASGGTGYHFFANGLTISSNAMLKGIGTVIGSTIINAGGMLAPGDAPGSITFSNNLTLAAGSTLALMLNGSGASQYSQIIGLGTISVSNCVLKISLGYTPSPGDSFTIISNLASSAILGTFVTTDGMAVPNGADFTVDNTTFQIDYGTFCSGFDVTLTALIPEPSSLLLTILGLVSLWTMLKRKQRSLP